MKYLGFLVALAVMFTLGAANQQPQTPAESVAVARTDPPPTPAPTPPAPAPTPVPIAPVAMLSGPATAAVGAPILLSPAGSVGDTEFIGDIKSNPVAIVILNLKDDSGAVAYGLAVAPKPGAYRFALVASGPEVNGKHKHKFAFLDVIVGDVPPPVPPAPPNPPTPTDPLTAALQAAYNADLMTDKADSLSALKGCYTNLTVAFNSPAVQKRLATVASAATWVKDVTEDPVAGLPVTKLVSVRKLIAAELTAAIGPSTSTAALDVGKFQAELLKVSTAIGGVK